MFLEMLLEEQKDKRGSEKFWKIDRIIYK